MKKILLLSLLLSLFTPLLVQAQIPEGVVVFSQGPNLGSVPKNAVRLPLLSITVRPDYEMLLSDLTILREGLSDNSQFGSIWAETDRYQRTMRRSLLNDDTVTLEFRNPALLPGNKTSYITVYGNMEDSRPGNTFRFVLNNLTLIPTQIPPLQERPPISPLPKEEVGPTLESQIQTTTPKPYVRKNRPRLKCKNMRCWRLY